MELAVGERDDIVLLVGWLSLLAGFADVDLAVERAGPGPGQ